MKVFRDDYPNNNSAEGIFTVSLDCELYWGVRDNRTIPQYDRNLLGVRRAVKEILTAFHDYDIHATWAIVGFLFFTDAQSLRTSLPDRLPQYIDPSLSPYTYIREADKLESVYHFAPDIVDLIREYEDQEIATHTFSHYYCLEEGQDAESFCADISSAIKKAESGGLKLKSLVFPRNQVNDEYLSLMTESGIKCYRGNESGWLHRAVCRKDESRLRRVLRILDAYINITGYNTHSLKRASSERPFNIPSSRFLRPYSRRLRWFENLRLRRIKEAMSDAARHNRIFHLWWHPHNFGINTTQNIVFMKMILEHYRLLKMKYGMVSLNMGEISELVERNSTWSREQ